MRPPYSLFAMYPFNTMRTVFQTPKKLTLLLTSLIIFLTSLISSHHAQAQSDACHPAWPAWSNFKQTFITADGRVIDHSGSIKPTVSEAQAYALFFALIANDKASFDSLLRWTENNLAYGDLTAHLPAWQWGKRTDDSWGIIDKNPASDADLWLAYTLSLAGDAWNEKRYTALSALLTKRILNEETADIPKLGLTLLPAPTGFVLADKSWKLNASYLPIQVLRWFDHTEKDPRWKQLLASSMQIISGSSPKGYTADWILFHPDKGFTPDINGAEKGDGGYNAIRVYLWAGMMHERDPDRAALIKTLLPMAKLTETKGYPPEYINIQSGEVRGPGSSGFSAALLPFLQAAKASKALQQQELRLQAQAIKADAYYDQVLSLFALGWREKRYVFSAKGKAEMAWQKACKKSG